MCPNCDQIKHANSMSEIVSELTTALLLILLIVVGAGMWWGVPVL